MSTILDVRSAVEQVEELNLLCASLRNAYRRAHPDAPETREERELRLLLEHLGQQHHVHLVPAYAD